MSQNKSLPISFEVGPFEVGPFEVGPFEVGPFEVGPFEVGPFEVGPFEVGPFEVGPFEVGPFEVTSLALIFCAVAHFFLLLFLQRPEKMFVIQKRHHNIFLRSDNNLRHFFRLK
jgi:hypothetical protein